MFSVLPKLAPLAGWFFLAALVAGAQTSSIQGSVEDQDHKPLAGVTVKIERQDTAGVYSVRTDKRGQLFYAGLPVGAYRVSCTGDAESGVEIRTQVGDPVNVKLTCVPGENRQANAGDQNRGPDREILDRIRADLDRVARDLDSFSSDETLRFNRARGKLVGFRLAWERGSFEAQVLEEVIRSLNDLIERSRLRSRDRDDLAEDSRRLRDLLAQHGGSSAAPVASGGQTSRQALSAAFDEGLAALRANDYRSAVAAFRRALDIDPNQDPVWANLAQAYAGMGSQVEAEKAYRRAVDLKPSVAAYRNNYAILLAKSGNTERAWIQLEEAARLDPGNGGQYFYNLGAILVSAGHNDEAGRAFAKSIDMNPDYAEAHYQYAVSLVEQGRVTPSGRVRGVARARSELETYLRLAPSGPNADSARALLEAIQRR